VRWLLLISLAACGGKRADDCTRLVDHLAPLFQSRDDQRDDAIARCRKSPPSARQLDCALAADTADAARACLKEKP
jgi:hypothetical protein